jgi:hypothetical protein
MIFSCQVKIFTKVLIYQQEVEMEKISSVVASSPRITSADAKDAGPVRSGTPGFGRETMPTSNRTPPSESTAERAIGARETVKERRKTELEHAAIAKKMSDQFFGKSTRRMPAAVTSEVPGNADSFSDGVKTGMKENSNRAALAEFAQRDELSPVVSKPAGFKSENIVTRETLDRDKREIESVMEPAIDSRLDELLRAPAGSSSQPPGLYPRGSFIDAEA